MQPPAHRPPTPWQIENARISKIECDLFFQNLDLILSHEAEILRCDEYFFCRPAFASKINVGSAVIGMANGHLEGQMLRKIRTAQRAY